MCVFQDVEAGPHEDRLIRRIFFDNHYYQSSRPVPIESSAIEVKFGITLQQIIDVVSRLSSHVQYAVIWVYSVLGAYEIET